MGITERAMWKKSTQCLYNVECDTKKIKKPLSRQLKSPLNAGRRIRSHSLWRVETILAIQDRWALKNNVNLVNTTKMYT